MDSLTLLINTHGDEHVLPGAKCACGLLPPAPGLIHSLLQAWIADHPRHTRKQHIFAYDVFKWLDGRSNGGRA